MEIIKRLDNIYTGPSAVTIGKFDGIHKGHRKLISHASDYKKDGLRTVVFTFDISSSKNRGEAEKKSSSDNRKEGEKKYIYTAAEKRLILAGCGTDVLIECPFDKKLSHMSAEEYFRDILAGRLGAKAIVVGEDFRFGYMRKGDTGLLKRLCRDYGIKLEIIRKELYDGEEIGSTRIRSEILRGNMEDANNMLGGAYALYGTVIYGKQLGRTLDMPTVNIAVDTCKLIPPMGVYASVVKYDGRIYKGVTNIGIKPTVEGRHDIGAETYIFDFDKNIYGEDIAVGLLGFIRAERKFDGICELKKQMHRDREEALRRTEGHQFMNRGELFG